MSYASYRRVDMAALLDELHREYGITDRAIGNMLATSRETINRVRHGQQSGRNIAPRLWVLLDALEQIDTMRYGE